MTIEKFKATSFKKAGFEDWQEKAAASLKGKPIESLYTNTYENIILKPLYTEDDLPEDLSGEIPGQPDFRRGIETLGYQSQTWHIANRIEYSSVAELKGNLDSALTRGQTAISFEVKQELFTNKSELVSFLASYKNKYPISLNAGNFQAPLLAALTMASKEEGMEERLSGFAGADPVAQASLTGGLSNDEKEYFASWSKLLSDAHEELPEVKTVLVDTTPYHNSGANAVQELAAAISTGVYLLERLSENGWEIKKALSKMIFHFAIGSNFFMETAKLRAARLLWSKAAEAFGAHAEERKMKISAETSRFTKTVFDPYVNLLRTGNEAFAAILGGIQFLHTGTFEEAAGRASAFSERVARNTQLVLQSEAHLEKVTDPAGGSWYVESLTRELAEKAWEMFLEMDKQGGICETLKSGWLQEQINTTAEARKQDIFKRKKSIIGTNVYANLSEKISEQVVKEKSSGFIAGTLAELIDLKEFPVENGVQELNSRFQALQPKRLAQPFEALRLRAKRLEEAGVQPSVGLICLGELKKHKARADFISGLLAAGGIDAVRSGEINQLSEAADFIASSHVQHFVLCGDNADYASFGVQFAKELIKEHSETKLFMAGRPDEDESGWRMAGIQEFMHVRSDAYQILTALLHDMEVRTDEKA
ncbi:methylmalonyl-CoA mutase family protein [Mesobacillus subterraneus]|uniref:Methylmalonyl-CoA mutase n=1 Tax=Mesobacillus subterraneus TaxID=285983 RepID=A0A3R9F0S3_9BACI|nr:methylmalonyl-CoA mutase family protein [Mesobacillus subterraneus]RSD27368.1 methylmalonyl-CoA mutase [Mesobacillus subterraneus]